MSLACASSAVPRRYMSYCALSAARLRIQLVGERNGDDYEERHYSVQPRAEPERRSGRLLDLSKRDDRC